MSFADIQSSPPTTVPPASGEDAEFSRLQNSLSLQVFKMNANVQRILKLVDHLGTTKDSAPLRKNLHDLTESTRAMAKRSSEDLKKLTALQHGEGRTKAVLAKTSHDLQLSLVAFQRAQQVSVERQRTVVEGVKLAVEEEQSVHEFNSLLMSYVLGRISNKRPQQHLRSVRPKLCSLSCHHTSLHTKNRLFRNARVTLEK